MKLVQRPSNEELLQTLPEQVSLREANAADAAFLLALAREAYREVLALQFGGWEETVHGRRFAEKVASLPFFVAELAGARVAAVSSSLHSDHLRVNELVVLPSFQNHGLGSRLLVRELENARKAGVPVRLHTFRLSRALRFYQRHGFVVVGRRDDYIDLEWAGEHSSGSGFRRA